MPSSTISSNQVINHSHPDAEYQIQTHAGIDDGAGIDRVTGAIIDAIRQVEGVRPDRPGDAMCLATSDSAMVCRNWTYQNGERSRHSQPLGTSSSAVATQEHPYMANSFLRTSAAAFPFATLASRTLLV